MKRGETVTFHTSLATSRFTRTHTHMPTHSTPAGVHTRPHIHIWSSSKGVNNYFAKGHNCDPWLVFKALSLNLNYPSSPSPPLVKWKCPLFQANTEITALMSSSWPPAYPATLHDTDAQLEFPHRHRRVKLFTVSQRNPNSTFSCYYATTCSEA